MTAMANGNSIAFDPVKIELLDQQILKLHFKSNRIQYESLMAIREFDERAGFIKWGFTDSVHYLAWRCDISLSTAREKLRIARALKTLPQMSKACAQGRLSYAKVRAMTRVATEDNEADLLEVARDKSADRVREYVQQMRNVLPESAEQAHRNFLDRSLIISRDLSTGTTRITIELPMDEGEVFTSAIDKSIEASSSESDRELPPHEQETFSVVQVDALMQIVRQYLAGENVDKDNNHASADASDGRAATADRYQVMIHVDQSALTTGEGRSDLPVDSVRRLSCDGSIVPIIGEFEGEPLAVGRKQRTVTAAIRRALWARDKGCSFPGCSHKRYVDAHHVKHWINGGETSLANTLLLCGTHHRYVHEGGYKIEKDHEGEWFFRRPDGRVLPKLGYQVDDLVDSDAEDDNVVDEKLEAAIKRASAGGFNVDRDVLKRYYEDAKSEMRSYCIKESPAEYGHDVSSQTIRSR